MKLLKALCLAAALMLTAGSLQAQTIKAATYNIRLLNRSDSLQGDGWCHRRDALCQLIRFHDFDIFGAQEVCYPQLTDMLGALPEYDYIGVGRDDGQREGEFSPVFYKREIFEKLDGGTFWLAPETSRPAFGWDAACRRVCSWGRFRHRPSGKQLWFFNLHMDHRGVEARRRSAELVLDTIRAMCGGQAVILTGDFNVDQYNESYALIAGSGTLQDSYETAPVRYALNGTFNAFDTDSSTDSRIDHIFVGGGIVVERYGILTDTYRSQTEKTKMPTGDFPQEVSSHRASARTPSDHFPVVTVLDISQACQPEGQFGRRRGRKK